MMDTIPSDLPSAERSDRTLTLMVTRCAKLLVSKRKIRGRVSMEEVTNIGVGRAKNVFQLQGAAVDGPAGQKPT